MKVPEFIWRYRLHHLLVWIIVGCIWFYLRYDIFSTMQRALVVTIIKTVDLALMVYIANYLLIPRLLHRKKYFAFVVTYLGMILISSMYKMHLIGKITHTAALIQWWTDIRGRVYDNMLPHFFLVTAGVSAQLLIDYSRVQRRLTAMAREKAEAELNFLKSQINPHFLFNSLNAVYFLIDKENVEARKALHTFSEMLRYQLYEIGDEKIPIEKEIGFLRDYIGLQSLRSDRCAVDMEVGIDLQGFSIEPLLLIPFVENSFKHLSHFSERSNEIRIDMWKDVDQLHFQVGNTTEGSNRNGAPGGIGLGNVRRRLQLLYPQRHQLNITEREGWFNIALQIQIEPCKPSAA